jgi:hypothetical protein
LCYVRAAKECLQTSGKFFGLFYAPCRPHAGSGLEHTLEDVAKGAAGLLLLLLLSSPRLWWPAASVDGLRRL